MSDWNAWLKVGNGRYMLNSRGRCATACTREEAEEECANEGGHLARVETKEDNDRLKEVFKEAALGDKQLWLGGSYQDGAWWEGEGEKSGKQLEYFNWAAKQVTQQNVIMIMIMIIIE